MYLSARGTGMCHLERCCVPCACCAAENTVNQGKAPQARAAIVRFQALTLPTHPGMEQVKKKEHNAMSLASGFSSSSYVQPLWLRFLQEADKTEETAFVRSCAAPQLLDRVFFTSTMCVRSPKKNNRTVTRFVQVTVFFEQITDSVQ